MRRIVAILACTSLGGVVSQARAQAVPEAAQAAEVDAGYFRTPHFGIDPFRHAFLPHWGFVFGVGASAENNAANFKDVGAIIFLADEDSLLAGDALDILGLVPRGAGFGASGQGELGVHLGGPFGRHLSIGFSAQSRQYGAVNIDEDAVALLRDGNGARQDFTLGDSRGLVLGSLEGGVHAVVRLGPLGTIDGVHLTLGFGGRYVAPFYYAGGGSTVANGGVVQVTGDSVVADVAVEKAYALSGDGHWDVGDLLQFRGSGIAADFLMRAEWPTSGLAFEVMVANLGKVTVNDVERTDWSFGVATTKIDDVLDSLDSDPVLSGVQLRDFSVRDTVDLDVTLPRIVRFSASAWANRILQLDVNTTLPFSGEFDVPLTVDLNSTWRFVRTLPIRLGLVFGGHQGFGYTGGVAIEGRTFMLRFAGGSLGGFIRDATGVSGRFEMGFFF